MNIVWGNGMRVAGIEKNARYHAFFFNPSTGAEHRLGTVNPLPDGTWTVPVHPELRDWILVLETKTAKV